MVNYSQLTCRVVSPAVGSLILLIRLLSLGCLYDSGHSWVKKYNGDLFFSYVMLSVSAYFSDFE